MTRGEPEDGRPIAVIGAGVVGCAIAFELAQRGVPSLLVDRDSPGSGCSYGNLAGIAVTEIVPQAMPGTFLQVPGWLMDPLGPLTVRWRDLPHLTPFLLHFLGAGRSRQVEATAAAMALLCTRAMSDTERMLHAAGIGHLLSDRECLALYDTEREIARDAPAFDLRARHGLACQRVSGAELCEIEPALARDFAGGWVYSGWRHVTDPHAVVTGWAEAAVAAGARYQAGAVDGFETDDQHVTALRLTSGEKIPVAGAVIAAGVWSGALARQLGDRVPLAAERGYHTMIAEPGFQTRHQIIHAPQGFGITPLGDGLRIGGSVELARADARPNFSRARILVKKARRIYPALSETRGPEWMGARPSTPDSRPVIGRASRWANVQYAFGHGHLGLTLAATTAALVADAMVVGRSNLDLAPFAAARFR